MNRSNVSSSLAKAALRVAVQNPTTGFVTGHDRLRARLIQDVYRKESYKSSGRAHRRAILFSRIRNVTANTPAVTDVAIRHYLPGEGR